MKQSGFIALLLILFVTLVARSQSSETTTAPRGMTAAQLREKAKALKLKGLVIDYDKFKDKTLISTEAQNLVSGMEAFAAGLGGRYGRTSGLPRALWFNVGLEVAGDRLAEAPTRYLMTFTSSSSSGLFNSGDANLYILYDDQRMELHPFTKDLGASSRSVSEVIAYDVTRSDLRKIVDAKKVEIKLGDTAPRKWKPDWLKRIGDLLVLTDF